MADHTTKIAVSKVNAPNGPGMLDVYYWPAQRRFMVTVGESELWAPDEGELRKKVERVGNQREKRKDYDVEVMDVDPSEGHMTPYVWRGFNAHKHTYRLAQRDAKGKLVSADGGEYACLIPAPLCTSDTQLAHLAAQTHAAWGTYQTARNALTAELCRITGRSIGDLRKRVSYGVSAENVADHEAQFAKLLESMPVKAKSIK